MESWFFHLHRICCCCHCCCYCYCCYCCCHDCCCYCRCFASAFSSCGCCVSTFHAACRHSARRREKAQAAGWKALQLEPDAVGGCMQPCATMLQHTVVMTHAVAGTSNHTVHFCSLLGRCNGHQARASWDWPVYLVALFAFLLLFFFLCSCSTRQGNVRQWARGQVGKHLPHQQTCGDSN